MSEFTRYKGFWVNKNGITNGRFLTKEECRQMLNGGGILIRNTYNWDKPTPTSYWYVIKDSFGGMEELPSKVRNQVKKSLKSYEFKKVDVETMLREGLTVYNNTLSRYSDGEYRKDEAWWRERIKRGQQEYWLGYDRTTGKPASYAINKLYDEYVDYSGMGFDPHYPNSTYPMYGLIFEMNRYYLKESKAGFVCDGARSISEHSNIQPFLEDKFKFRKAYCDLQIAYQPWLGMVVRMLFPFRRWIKNVKVTAILRQEAWARGLSL